MTTRQGGYRFATEAQWNACLFESADRDSVGASTGLHPFAPYARPAKLHASDGAFAPVSTRAGEQLWRDGRGHLLRLGPGDERPEIFTAPYAIAQATRIVANSGGLWVAGDAPATLHCYEEDTFTRRLVVEIPGARVVDLAGDGHDGLLALVEQGGEWRVVRLDCGGKIASTVTLEGIIQAVALVYLRRFDRIVVLAGSGPRLYWFMPTGGAALSSLATRGLRPCFEVTAIGSDTRGRIFVAGFDGPAFGGAPYVVFVDGYGDVVGDLPLQAQATGVAATRRTLLVTTQAGLYVFSTADSVPESASEIRAVVVTPMLLAPDREDARRWLRIEAAADLGPGATLELAYASTDDPEIRDRLAAIAADASLPASARARKIRAEADVWHAPVVFHGGAQAAGAEIPFTAPLHDVHDRFVWVSVTLIAAPRAQLPVLTRLSVLYPGRTLMEHLPMIYQRAESEPGDFLRALVGVLESTTQNLDERIAMMGSHVHPATAAPEWLDFIARWLGLPWDDGLDPAQKRCIVLHAAAIARGRGTRAGLEAFLECLVPGTPRRFRVSDAAADLGFAVAGGDTCKGSALPAVLGGLPITATALNAKAVIGYMRLPCAGQVEDGAWQIAGRIRIEVAASAAERARWAPWLRTLLTQMAPLTTRVDLRWVTAGALRGDQLDSTLTLEAAPTAHVGNDAVMGIARLPERGTTLSASGPDSGTRLH
jgi:phage tail-like protein